MKLVSAEVVWQAFPNGGRSTAVQLVLQDGDRVYRKLCKVSSCQRLVTPTNKLKGEVAYTVMKATKEALRDSIYDKGGDPKPAPDLIAWCEQLTAQERAVLSRARELLMGT